MLVVESVFTCVGAFCMTMIRVSDPDLHLPIGRHGLSVMVTSSIAMSDLELLPTASQHTRNCGILLMETDTTFHSGPWSPET